MKQLAPLDPKSMLPWERTAVVESAEPGLPGLSLVMPIYNAGPYLERTLRSLLFNDLTGVQVVVMDGGSTDHTPEILKHYAGLLSLVRSERDRGQSDAINKGFAECRGPILGWLNGDDLLLPNALLHVRRHFARHSDSHVAVGNAYMTDLDLSPIRHFKFTAETLRYDHLIDYARNHLVQPSVFFTREAWGRAGPVDLDLHYAMDADLFLRMVRLFEMTALDLDLAYSVYHDDCKTKSARGRSIIELAIVQARNGGAKASEATLEMAAQLCTDYEARLQSTSATAGAVQGSREAALKARVAELERRLAALAEQALAVELLEPK